MGKRSAFHILRHGQLPDAPIAQDRSRRPGRQRRSDTAPAVRHQRRQAPGWERWSDAEKVQHLLGLTLDRVHDYLSWPPDNLDPHRLAAQVQAARVVTMVAARAGVEARRSREREQALEALIKE